jgi:hypothetical protein
MPANHATRVDDRGKCGLCGASVRRDNWFHHWRDEHPGTTLPTFPEEFARSSKPLTYTCERCGLTSFAPIVRAVANPKAEDHGRCSNKTACEHRARRNANRETAKSETHGSPN